MQRDSIWRHLWTPLMVCGTLLGAATWGSTASQSQTIQNPGFESGVDGWYGGGSPGVNNLNPRSGANNAYNNGGYNSIFQNVSGFSPNTQYTLTAWGKLNGANPNSQCFYASNDGGATFTKVNITSTTYAQYSLTFTTGSNTTVQIGQLDDNGSGIAAFSDDYALTRAGTSTPTPTATATPTPTATPTATPTPTPTATPGALIDRTLESGGLITARGENGTYEGKEQAFDNDINSKWLDFSATSWIQYQFAGNASRVITSYKITSGNDAPGRDPKNWTLQGSNDGSNFVNVNTQSNQAFASRNLTKTYSFTNGTAYKMYRLNITANTDGSGITQMSELRLLGPGGASTPTPTATPTPTPSGTDVTYSFSDMPTAGGVVDGVHSGINFGNGLWGGGDNWYGLVACGYYTSDVTSRSFTLPAGKRLKSIKLATGIAGSTWSVSDGVNPTKSGTFAAANTPITVTTGWANAGTNVTVAMSASWDTSVDDIVYGGSGTSTPTPTATPAPSPLPGTPSSYTVTRVRFFPRAGLTDRMVGGKFSGSNTSPTNNFTPFYTITSTPPDNAWTDITFNNPTTYRYIKYEAPAGSWGNVAELEFYNGSTRLSGVNFGTAGSYNNSGNSYDKALDGNTTTFFDAASGNDQYVGIDLGTYSQVMTPTFSPAPGAYSSAQTVTMSAATAQGSPTIRYTTDGTTPTRTSGIIGNSVTVNATTTIRAIAYQNGLADSGLAVGTYTIGSSSTPTPTPSVSTVSRVYHFGNSLTDVLNYNAFKDLVQSRGNVYDYGRDVIPGAPLDWLYDHPTNGFSEEPYGLYPNALPNYRWDAVTFQPFDRTSDEDVIACKNFINLARQFPANSNTQFYIYQHWMRKADDNPSTYLNYDAEWLKPYTGGYGAENKAFFTRLITDLRAQTPYLSKPVLMIPVGDVMYELNQRMKAGQVPGYSDITQWYADGIHLNNIGSMMTGATFYATIYKSDPHGASYALYAAANGAADRPISPALANAIYDAVWDVVRNHPYSGVS